MTHDYKITIINKSQFKLKIYYSIDDEDYYEIPEHKRFDYSKTYKNNYNRYVRFIWSNPGETIIPYLHKKIFFNELCLKPNYSYKLKEDFIKIINYHDEKNKDKDYKNSESKIEELNSTESNSTELKNYNNPKLKMLFEKYNNQMTIKTTEVDKNKLIQEKILLLTTLCVENNFKMEMFSNDHEIKISISIPK